MISGYFLVSQEGTFAAAKIKRTFIKLLKLTIIAKLIYVFWSYINMTPNRYDWTFPTQLDYYVKFLITGESVIGLHLWYLWAYLQALAVLWFATKLRVTKLIFVVAPIGIIAGLLLGSYSFVGGWNCEDIGMYRNMFTIVLPFVLLGALIRRNEGKIAKIGNLPIIVLLLTVGIYAEYFCFKFFGLESKDIMIFTILLAPVVFVLCLRSALPEKWTFMRELGQHHSLNLYIYHILVRDIMYLVLPPIVRLYAVWPLTVLATLCLSWGINAVSERWPRGLGWLKMA